MDLEVDLEMDLEVDLEVLRQATANVCCAIPEARWCVQCRASWLLGRA